MIDYDKKYLSYDISDYVLSFFVIVWFCFIFLCKLHSLQIEQNEHWLILIHILFFLSFFTRERFKSIRISIMTDAIRMNSASYDAGGSGMVLDPTDPKNVLNSTTVTQAKQRVQFAETYSHSIMYVKVALLGNTYTTHLLIGIVAFITAKVLILAFPFISPI